MSLPVDPLQNPAILFESYDLPISPRMREKLEELGVSFEETDVNYVTNSRNKRQNQRAFREDQFVGYSNPLNQGLRLDGSGNVNRATLDAGASSVTLSGNNVLNWLESYDDIGKLRTHQQEGSHNSVFIDGNIDEAQLGGRVDAPEAEGSSLNSTVELLTTGSIEKLDITGKGHYQEVSTLGSVTQLNLAGDRTWQALSIGNGIASGGDYHSIENLLSTGNNQKTSLNLFTDNPSQPNFLKTYTEQGDNNHLQAIIDGDIGDVEVKGNSNTIHLDTNGETGVVVAKGNGNQVSIVENGLYEASTGELLAEHISQLTNPGTVDYELGGGNNAFDINNLQELKEQSLYFTAEDSQLSYIGAGTQNNAWLMGNNNEILYDVGKQVLGFTENSTDPLGEKRGKDVVVVGGEGNNVYVNTQDDDDLILVHSKENTYDEHTGKAVAGSDVIDEMTATINTTDRLKQGILEDISMEQDVMILEGQGWEAEQAKDELGADIVILTREGQSVTTDPHTTILTTGDKSITEFENMLMEDQKNNQGDYSRTWKDVIDISDESKLNELGLTRLDTQKQATLHDKTMSQMSMAGAVEPESIEAQILDMKKLQESLEDGDIKVSRHQTEAILALYIRALEDKKRMAEDEKPVWNDLADYSTQDLVYRPDQSRGQVAPAQEWHWQNQASELPPPVTEA